MQPSSPVIGICSIGTVPPIFEKIIAGHLAGYLRLKVQTLPPLHLAPSAFVPERHQYDAAAIITQMESTLPDTCAKLVGVTSADLCIPIFTHVFGEARQNGRVAVISTFRLLQFAPESKPAQSIVYERAAKVAMHELGHLFNLFHCDDHTCLMHFCGNLEELDRISPFYCRYCRAFLQNNLVRADDINHLG